MALTPRLELRQSQSLVMTPQLQQAIKLLQLSNLELSAYVEQELERNPLLERADGDGVPEGGSEPEHLDDRGASAAREAGADAIPTGVSAETMDVDVDNVFTNDSTADADHGREGGDGAVGGMGGDDGFGAFGNWSNRGGGFGDAAMDLEQSLPGAVTLREHLLSQIGTDLADPVDRVIAAHLVEMLDESGYLVGDLDVAAEALGCDRDRVEATIARVQHFDPPGIFARSLKECLALQLRDRNRLDPAIQALLDNLELLAKRDIAALAKCCGVEREEVVEMVAEIRALDPKPALAFDHAVAQPVTPDILMRAKSGGGWIVELNTDTLPKVLVNNTYYAEVRERASTKSDKQYITECLQTASWLVKSLHQRATTILKVATEIVRQQDAFFAKGVQHLRPLILRDIAEAIEMHESTVSRVTSNKYIATPRGIFELKYFFTTAIGGTEGVSHSAEAVRHRIKALIDAESAGAVLSDDTIVDLLKAEGVDIARRTVAKYREGLGIPSSVQRRREKRAGL